MSETSQGEGWGGAGDGRWYPPGTAPPPLAPSMDASLTRQASMNLSPKASQDDAPTEQVSAWGTSSTADQGAGAPPSSPSPSSGVTVVADPASRWKPLLR